MAIMADAKIEPEPIVSSMLDDLAAGKAVPAFEPAGPVRQRKQRSDAGVPRGPRNVPIDEDATLPARGRGRPRKGAVPAPPTKADISDMIQMAHTIAETMISPKAAIKKDDADRIAEKMVPVLEDYGVVVVGKVVHLIGLIAAVVAIEGPIAYAVMKDAQEQARIAAVERRTASAMPTQTPPTPIRQNREEPVDIARILGMEAGEPNVVPVAG